MSSPPRKTEWCTSRTLGRIPAVTLWERLGPGLITGASDDDPGGIATYTVAGATLGYATLWTAVITSPLMVAVQLICARIGLVAGVGLTGACRRHYSRAMLVA